MSIERVKDRMILRPDSWKDSGWSPQGYHDQIITVRSCAICGKDLLNHDFIFWRGKEFWGFHAECARQLALRLLRGERPRKFRTEPARHMALGLFRDVAVLTGSLAHRMPVKLLRKKGYVHG